MALGSPSNDNGPKKNSPGSSLTSRTAGEASLGRPDIDPCQILDLNLSGASLRRLDAGPETKTVHTFEKIQGLTVIPIEGKRFLLDTGSVSSYGPPGDYYFCGSKVSFPLLGKTESRTLDRLSGALGVKIDGVLGSDLLLHLPLAIDWNASRVWQPSRQELQDGEDVDVGVSAGHPSISVNLGGHRIIAALNTGIGTSLFVKKYLDKAKLLTSPADSAMHEMGGAHQLFEDVAILGRSSYKAQVGAASFGASLALTVRGLQGIIGNDLFSNFAKVILDLPSERIMLPKLPSIKVRLEQSGNGNPPKLTE